MATKTSNAMNIENLRAFVEVTATGSFQKASENLHITQSTVSARIKTLEDRLNRQLFTRLPQGVALTAGGKSFYRHALAVIQSWERAQQEVALPEGAESSVSLGVPLNYWHNTACRWLAWMQQHAAHIAPQLQSDYSVFLLQKLREGLLDMAIVYEPQHSPDIVIRPYQRQELVMVSSHPRDIQQGQAEGYIYVDWGPSFREMHRQAYPGVPQHRLSVALEMVALEHILQRGGSGYISMQNAAPLLESGRLFPVKGATQLSVQSLLVYSSIRQQEESIQTAIKGLEAVRAAD
ncbi:LysR family transcriptional regulator [Marinobacterium jannaschii]|uniref:LysR family transcriptional regulator n=1 Tax=Marinobacterium jannaschii TaxID=64970 RepID=UPI0012EB3615|nr:LysR family transcriptional regulator [Marinobacterium jannaschii]